jgi:hypothetical protein
MICAANMIALYSSIIFSNFDLKVLSNGDQFFIVLTFLTLILYAILYAFVGRNISDLIVLQEKGVFEFQQYKDMFNCLQEGILVIKENLGKSQTPLEKNESAYKMYFINHIADRILSKVMSTRRIMRKNSSINKDNLHKKKIFYEFKNIQAHNLEKD